ncbi:uncharacterized protein T069G_10332 [Trichoderma breve]|uniref:Uncharacterized protein n=1 Tax=Trichoderma breve TaxID=2034170 RepID=A0A9W9B3K9_9HYPO|nr:uncharacterized protein T069G_10332 [Trichoderma breve]KAJ4854774.1 hypothetical protein T069G_10332 [Trichoderma breve]
MAYKTTEFGDYVDQILVKAFFQPDDELSLKTVGEYFASDFEANINGGPIPGDAYKAAIVSSRAKSIFKVVKVEEILASHDADKAKGGSVAHHTVFSVTDKETGVEKQESTLTIITCAEQNGKVVLKSLTEVFHQ